MKRQVSPAPRTTGEKGNLQAEAESLPVPTPYPTLGQQRREGHIKP